MKTLAFLLAVVCIIVSAMYYLLPGGSLPTFMPGYAADSTRIHMLHGFAAVTGAVVFLLIGLSRRRLITGSLDCRTRYE
jgi:amino acid permease